MPIAASDAGQVVRLEANAEKSWSVVPIVASRPSKMLLMHGNVAFAAHERDPPESDDICNELKNGISAGSNISDFPALSRMKTTVRNRCDGTKPRAWSPRSNVSRGTTLHTAASNKMIGTKPSLMIDHV